MRSAIFWTWSKPKVVDAAHRDPASLEREEFYEVITEAAAVCTPGVTVLYGSVFEEPHETEGLQST